MARANGPDDEAPAPPSAPPILGTDPSPWMTAEEIRRH
jgi:hypothetical protein